MVVVGELGVVIIAVPGLLARAVQVPGVVVAAMVTEPDIQASRSGPAFTCWMPMFAPVTASVVVITEMAELGVPASFPVPAPLLVPKVSPALAHPAGRLVEAGAGAKFCQHPDPCFGRRRGRNPQIGRRRQAKRRNRRGIARIASRHGVDVRTIGFGTRAVKCDTCCRARGPGEQDVPVAQPTPGPIPDGG